MSEDLQSAIEAGKQIGILTGAAKRAADDGIPYAAVPQDFTVISLEQYLGKPRMIRASPVFLDPESYCVYVNRFKEEETTLFGDQPQLRIAALLDYHAPDGPAHCAHRATLQLRHSPEWQAWVGIHGKPIAQVPFAEFLEDHADDISDPDGAAVLEAAMDLEAKKTVAFKSGVNLRNGTQQLIYLEDLEEKKGKGTITLPSELFLEIPVFEHGQVVGLKAKLRYRIDDGALSFIVKLQTVADKLREAFDLECREVNGATDLQVLFGAPGA